MKGLETMDLQADINWIQSEISNVRGPQLIVAFKNLLNYRNSKEVDLGMGASLEFKLSASQKEELDNRLDKYDNGNAELLSWEEVKSSIKSN